MKYNKILKFAIAAVLSLGAVACSQKEQFDEITELNLVRCLEPMNLDAKVSAALGDVVTFSWDVAKDAESYLLTIYTDESLSSVFSSTTLQPSQVPYTVKLEADATYYFTVVAQKEGKKDSKVAAYTKAIKTYAVKDNLFLKLLDRSETTLTVGWSKEVADYQEVDRIVVRHPADESTEQTFALSSAEIEDAQKLIEGFEPGMEYEIILYYKSASRGQINAWTAARTDGFTEVSSLDGLKNAILTSNAQVYLTLAGSPYDIEALDITTGFSIVGELDVDGNTPVLTGELHIADSWNGNGLYFENVTFDGAPTALAPSGFGFAIQNKNGGTVKGKDIGDITYRNCVITNYTKGLIYEWGNNMVLGDVAYDSCEITNINADGTVGGDCFDIRQATTIESLSFVNNTVSQGMRTFVRIDAGTLGKLIFENNTLNNLCFVDNANNAGIFGLQIIPGEFSFKKNLFLNMSGKATLESANTKYKNAGDLGVAASENYFYGLPSTDGVITFFTDNFTMAQAGGTILEDAPCYNAAGGYFNILMDSAIAGKQIGASKWWTPYVEEPEDLTMVPVPVPHTWNLANAKYFSGSIKKQMVRDYLFVSGSESLPIVAADGNLNFGSSVVVNRQGVPQHNYVAFHTDVPGSLVIKAANPGDYTGHLVVGVGPVDGTSIALKGGVSALAEQDNTTKILITSITEESVVYIYPSGPVALSELSWTPDVTAVNTALPTPEPVATPASIKVGEATDIVVSWEPVENAAGYSVVFNGKSFSVSEPEYTIGATTTGMLDPGAYKVMVYANPGADDIYNTESAAGVAAFAVLPDGGSEGGETVVSDVEGLLAAIAAGKDAITLAEGEYKLGGEFVVTAPLALKGQDGAVVYGGFKLIGEVGSFSADNLTVVGSDPDNKADIFLNLDNTGVSCSDIVIRNTVVDGFAKSVIYASNTADVFDLGNVTFNGVEVKNHGTGQGVFDLRNGKYNTFTLTESTVTGGRDFLRIDAPCSIYAVNVTKNTLNNLNDNANANGVFCVRATPSVYEVSYNIIANIANSISGRTAAAKPKMKKNVWYNIGENFYTGCIDAELAMEGDGVLLSADPFKDAANGDYTLTNAVVMSLGAGASKWNPSVPASDTGVGITVNSAEEFTAAIEAGKTAIMFSEGEYDLTAIPVTLTADMRLSGEGHRTTLKVGQFGLAEGELGNIIIEMLDIIGDGANNFINVANASVVRNLTVRNCDISNIGKSIFYGNAEGSAFDAVVFQNVKMSQLGGGQGTIDIRKGAYGVVTVEGCTVVGGRDFIRADKDRVTGAVKIVNNTFDGVTLNNGNGILYVRSTPETYIFKNNLFLNENGENNKLSKDTGITVPDVVGGNFFYNCTAEAFWTGLINQEVALAGGGVILANNPVRDAENGDYTLVDGLCLASNVGAYEWNPNAGLVLMDVTVSNVVELVNALDAGKTGIELKAGTYDLREANEGGVLNLINEAHLVGNGKVEIIGGFKLGLGTFAFTATGILFNGAEKAMGNALEIAEATQLDRISIQSCEFVDYNKSLFYGNGVDSKVDLFSFENNLVHGFGTGQGMLDIRKGVYGTVNISKNSFYDGGRDFVRIDKEIAGSIAIVNNTFAACSIGAGNGLLWIRSLADAPSKYTVAKNLFLNLTGENTILAKSGATVPEMSNNWFFNVSEGFFGGAISQEVAVSNGGGVLAEDPCAGSAEFNLKLVNADLKKADVGDPRWNSASPYYKPKK